MYFCFFFALFTFRYRWLCIMKHFVQIVQNSLSTNYIRRSKVHWAASSKLHWSHLERHLLVYTIYYKLYTMLSAPTMHINSWIVGPKQKRTVNPPASSNMYFIWHQNGNPINLYVSCVLHLCCGFCILSILYILWERKNKNKFIVRCIEQ